MNTSDIGLPKTSHIDSLFIRDWKVVSCAEVKSREITSHELNLFGSLLISKQKIDHGQAVSRALMVPFVVIAGLIDALYWWKVTDCAGTFLIESKNETRKTKATCNGGSKVDRVTLLPMCAARREEWVE